MAQDADREHYIPLRLTDLLDLACAELEEPEQARLRAFARLLAAIFHFEYHRSLEALKEAYAPFDPDEDVRLLTPWTAAERTRRLAELFTRFDELMTRANFTRLTQDKLEAAFASVSAWGIPMHVDFSQFERLEVYARGDAVGQRVRKSWRTRWKEQVLEVPLLQRVVIIVKLNPTKEVQALGIDTERVFLKIFKDIPKADLEMLLPGARVRFNNVDRGKIGFPLLTGAGMTGWNILKATALGGLAGGPGALLWGAAAGTLGYGWRSYYSYNFRKNLYSLQLTKSLYYQNLDNNAGVLFRLIDAAEEQECREALLGYFFLWRAAGPDGCTSAQLDERVEQFLAARAGVNVDFEIDDALAKLIRHGLVEARPDGRLTALPIDAALARLDHTWDNYFQFNK
jgi:hypothetical protein